MKPILVAIEGTDASGKETQSKKLCEVLGRKGYKAHVVSFPTYGEPSAKLVECLLRGDFSQQDLSPKQTSAFFAINRSVAMKEIMNKYSDYDYIILDRYVMSNGIHQTLTMKGESKYQFLSWLKHLEYEMLEVPKEDMVIFLDMPAEAAILLLKDRKGKAGIKGDIYENEGFIRSSYQSAKDIAQHENWHTVSCVSGTGLDAKIKSREAISDEVLQIVLTERSG